MPYLEKTIKCGDYVHTQRYFAAHTGKRIPRQGIEKESAEDQRKRNDRHARFRLECLLQTNFPQGTFITLTHREKIPIEEQEAKRRANRYIRDLREDMKKHGEELRYILIHEQQGGRWHHHLITNETSLDAVAKLWEKGRVIPSRLDKAQGYSDLAAYLTEQHKPPKGKPEAENGKTTRRKHGRRWISSRNLIQPVVKVREIKRTGVMNKYPKAKKGYQLLPNWTCGSDMAGNVWQHFTCVKIPEPGKAHSRKKGRVNSG